MKKIVLIALVLLVMVGCGPDLWYTEEEAINKAHGLVQQECSTSPEYSMHRLPITAYDARYDEDEGFWIVDVGTFPQLILVMEKPWEQDMRGVVFWGTLGTGSRGDFEKEWIAKHFEKYCGPDLPESLQQ
jgi:hypothetical protein